MMSGPQKTRQSQGPAGAHPAESLHGAPLGEQSQYIETYSPDLLYPIARAEARASLGIKAGLPFSGADLWTAHELSWLDPRGKPHVAAMSVVIAADSTCLVESKSFKLYLNSFNQTVVSSPAELTQTITRDLSAKVGCAVKVTLLNERSYLDASTKMEGESIDQLAVTCSTYHPDASLLSTQKQHGTETLLSDLLKSNCPVTGQPDWARLMVRYVGPKIARESLLQYIVSFRGHAGFHEQCVEKIFLDIKQRCHCEKLTVYARYTRRGGLDINPFRSDFEAVPENNDRVFRQ